MSNLGQIIDGYGDVKYHLVSSFTTKLVIGMFAILLMSLVVMMLIILGNRYDIQRIEIEQERLHQQSNATYNSNR